MKALLVSSAIVLMSMSAASAQSAGSTANPQHSATAPSSSSAATTQPNSTSANNEPLRQQVRDNLSKAGFTDIKIMPTSFMVRAKDQSGNPVMMVINPDSFTEVTAVQNNKDTNQNTSKDSASSATKH